MRARYRRWRRQRRISSLRRRIARTEGAINDYQTELQRLRSELGAL